MKKRYTYKLRPGAGAVALLTRHAGTCRWVWNECVKRLENRESTTQTNLMRHLTELRRSTDWLGSQPVVPQQQVIRDFIVARKAFFDKTRNRPKIKKKLNTQPSLNYTKRGFSINKNGRLRLAGGIIIPVVWSRPFPSPPSSVRVYRDSAGWWWASFVCEIENKTKPRENNGKIGIDWGIKTPATTTNTKFDLEYTPRVKDNAQRLAKYQKQMAIHHKNKDWKSYNKAKKKAAKLHRKIKNQRREQTRRWAQKIAKNNEVIAAEDFKPEFTQTNRKMAKKATENAIGIAKQELENAAQKYGCELIMIDPKYTTMDCSKCGARHKTRLELKIRTFKCENCGVSLNRDYNAARNMLIRAGFNPSGDEGCKTASCCSDGERLAEPGIPRL